MKVLLDTGVLGLLTHKDAQKGRPCVQWMRNMIQSGARMIVPEICDYELRRKLTHLNSRKSLRRLDQLKESLDFEVVDSSTWLRAADIWAQCRTAGKQLAPDDALDGDVLLIAVSERVGAGPGGPTVIATTNVKHLSSFADAKKWEDVTFP